MTTAIAKVTRARARFKTPDAQKVWVLVQAKIGMQPSETSRTLDAWNGYPIVRIEDLTPENHPFEPEDDDGDYFRA